MILALYVGDGKSQIGGICKRSGTACLKLKKLPKIKCSGKTHPKYSIYWRYTVKSYMTEYLCAL